MKTRVAIDVALIGWAKQNQVYARGVHRVAEQIVDGLLGLDEFELSFVATSRLSGAFEALAEKWPGAEKRLCYSPYQLALSRLASRWSAWIHRSLQDRRLHLRILRWLMHQASQWADKVAGRIPRTALRRMDIYHSPLHPIPTAVQRSRSVKCFLTVHDLIPLTRPETVEGRGAALLARQLDSLAPDAFAFCVSHSVRRDLLTLKSLQPDHVTVTPLAADPAKFHRVLDEVKRRATCSRYGIPPQPYFLALSSFDPRKNFAHVIDCFGEMATAGGVGDANLVIVGTDPERNRVTDASLAKFPRVRDRIICPGFVPDEDIAAIYSAALAFLFPSLAEGFGMPPLEAMRCGVPVICSDAEAIPEVVGEAAILLPPTDAEAWKQALREIWENNALRERLSASGMTRSSQFSWAAFTESVAAGYRQASRTVGSIL